MQLVFLYTALFLCGLKKLAVTRLQCPSDNTTVVSGHTFVLGLSETDDTF
jgi:hypothetical protein